MENFPAWICEEIIAEYHKRGLTSLFHWQAELLSNDKLRSPQYKNLVFSAPTSAGKTIVAELIALNTILVRKRKALFIFPYISVAREKFLNLQRLWRIINLRVRAYMGASSAPLDSWDAAVCTIEKANSLLNKAIDEGTLDAIGVVVVDEFHMVFDSNRGQIIEHIIAKLLYASTHLSQQIQIIAMSATFANLAELGDWLNAQQFETDFRPIELEERILIGTNVCDVRTFRPLRALPPRSEVPSDPEHIVQLCVESLSSGDSVLVFCSSKSETEKVASAVSAYLKDSLSQEPLPDFHRFIKKEALSSFTEFFRNETQSNDEVLLSVIPTGVAFHHAGLTVEERETIEDGFRGGIIRILMATSTLSSGVNLPAQRVIIKAQTSGPCALTNTNYSQMVGRAGRLGQSLKGESILVCRREQLEFVKRVLQRAPYPLSRSSLKRRRLKLIVEAVCSGLCNKIDELNDLLRLTYFNSAITRIEDDVEWLISKRLLAIQKDASDDVLRGTQLGGAVLASSLPPDIALLVYADLERASRALVLDSELHLLYLVTPMNNAAIWTGYLDWSHYYTIWSKLPFKLRRVGEIVGISERFLLERMQGIVTANNADIQIHLRFMSALALYELINERPLHIVAHRFRINRGALQSLQQQSATYACMVVAFCERLGWVYLRSILDGFSERLAFGVRRELTELVKLEGIDGRRARAFHTAHITTIAALATTSIQQIARILRSAVPFTVKGDNREGLNRWLAGEEAMTDFDAAALLALRARKHVASSLRGLGVFSETQLSLLLSTAEREIDQREVCEAISTHMTQSLLSTAMEENVKRSDFNDESVFELSSGDFFDSSSIFDEKYTADDRRDVVSEDSKENRIENDSTLMCNKFGGNEFLHRDEANDSANVAEEEASIERITKKMNRASLSPSKRNRSLRALSTANFNMSLDSKMENSFENAPFADHHLSATLIEKRLGENGEVQSLTNEPSEKVRSIAKGNEEIGNSKSATLDSELEWSISDSAFYEYLSCERSSLKPKLIRTSEEDFINVNDSVSDSVLLGLPSQKEDESEITLKTEETERTSTYVKDVNDSVSDSVLLGLPSQKEDEPEITLETEETERTSTYVKENIVWNEVDGNKLESENLATDEIASSAAPIIFSASTSITNIREASGFKGANMLVNRGVSVGVDDSSQLLIRHQDTDLLPKEEELEFCSFDRSGDLFETSQSPSVASDSPYEVSLKRVRQRYSIKSPLSPICHSPLSKVVKLSSPSTTANFISPLALPKTSSPLSPKNICSSKVDGNSGDLSAPLKRGGRIRLNSSPSLREWGDNKRSFGFTIDDVCRSESRWLNFVEEVSSWDDIGVGVCLGKRNALHEVTVVAVALCSRDGNPAFIPFDDSSVYEERVGLFEEVLASTQRKIFFDLMAAMRALNPPTFSSDLVVNRLSNCVCAKTLSFLAHFRKSDNEHPLSFQELIARVPSVRALVLKESSSGRVAASVFAFVNIRLYEWLLPLATRLSSEKSVSLELESTELLARLEARGIAFDREAGHDMLQRVKSEMSSLEAEGRRLASMPFNFDSPSEIANVLFVRMGIQPVSGCGGSGVPRRHYSTNKEVLQRLAPRHRIAAIVLKWRKLNNALSSSLQNLLQACRSNGRIHASFTTFTGTGRMQSVHPNVQNVQKDALIDSLSVRSLFVAPPGFVLVSADYSQLELRVLAGLSKDEGLCKLFCAGADFFQTVTDRWNADTSIDVPLDRQKVKQLCYAIIYGMGAVTLGERIGATKQKAQHLIESFFKEFPKVRSWMDATLESCQRDACAVTILGRRRPLKCGESVVQSDRARTERQAINSTIQGSASEIFKSALLKLEKSLKDLDARIVMQVHDEVIVELNEACFSIAVERIESAMLNAFPEFPVPLAVKISSGTNWGSLLPLNS